MDNPVQALQQWAQPNVGANPYQTAAPTLTELMMGAAGGALNPNRAIPYRSTGGAVGIAAQRFAGGLLSGLSQAMGAQRIDPNARDYAIAQQVANQINQPPVPVGPQNIRLQGPIPESGPPAPPMDIGLPPNMSPANPLAGITANQLMASKVFPLVATGLDPLRRAEIAAHEAQANRPLRVEGVGLVDARDPTRVLVPEAPKPPTVTEQLNVKQAQRDQLLRERVASLDPASPTYGRDLARLQLETGGNRSAIQSTLEALNSEQTKANQEETRRQVQQQIGISAGHLALARDIAERAKDPKKMDTNAISQYLSAARNLLNTPQVHSNPGMQSEILHNIAILNAELTSRMEGNQPPLPKINPSAEKFVRDPKTGMLVPAGPPAADY